MLKKVDHLTDGIRAMAADQNGGSRLVRAGAQALVMLLVLAIGFAGMSWLISNSDDPPKRPTFKTVYTVASTKAEAGDYQPNMLIYGSVVAARSVDLRSLASGEIISVSPDLQAGALIEKGESLLEIDRFSFEGALSEAVANLEESRARIQENQARIDIESSRIESLREQLVLARNDLDRIKSLKQRGTATDKQVEDRELIVSQRSQALEQSELNLVAEKARLAQQKAVSKRLEWRVQQAERNLKDTVLVAPFTGVVSTNNAEIGRMVGANDLVVSMYDASRLDVRFTLTDQRFGRIQSDDTGVIGRQVEVIWSVGGREYRFPAVIERIGAQIASDRGGVEVIARLKGEVAASPLRPGAFVEVIVPDKEFKDHFRLPETSLYDGELVYAIVDGKLLARKIKVAARDGDAVIVSGDLTDGEEVLVTRISEISEDLQVRTETDAGSRP